MVKIPQAKAVDSINHHTATGEYKHTASSLDSFSKIMGIVFILLIIVVPLLAKSGIVSFIGIENAAFDLLITNPTDGSTIVRGSTVMVTVQTHNISQVAYITMYINHKLLCQVNTPPYICSWTLSQEKKAAYLIEATLTSKQKNSFHTHARVTSSNQ